MNVGDRIYYTGDRANGSSTGTIINYRQPSEYVPESVDVQYDEERFEGDTKFSKMIPISGFTPGPGRRFWLLDEWESEKKKKLQQMLNQ